MNIVSKFTPYYNVNLYLGAEKFMVKNVCCKKMQRVLNSGYYQLSKKGFKIHMGDMWKQSTLKYCPFCGEEIEVK